MTNGFAIVQLENRFDHELFARINQNLVDKRPSLAINSTMTSIGLLRDAVEDFLDVLKFLLEDGTYNEIAFRPDEESSEWRIYWINF